MLTGCVQKRWAETAISAQFLLSDHLHKLAQELEKTKEQLQNKTSAVEDLENENFRLKEDLHVSELEIQKQTKQIGLLQCNAHAAESENKKNKDAKEKLDRLRERWTNFAAHFGPDIKEELVDDD